MQLRQLEYLVTLQREQHFARAAVACRVSQPALSEAIRRLERELGTILIERDHAFHRMTPTGDRVVEWAKRILDDERALHDEISSMRSQLSGVLRLAAIPSATSAIAGLARPFTLAHPLATVAIDADQPSTRIIEGLGAFEYDAGITYVDDLPSELRAVPLYRERFCIAVPREMTDPSWETDGFPLQRIADLPIVTLSARNQWRRMLDDALLRRGIAMVPKMEADSVGVVTALLTGGGVAAVATRDWVRSFLLPKSVVLLPLDLEISPSIGLVVRADEPATPMVQATLDAVKHFERAEALRLP